MNHLHTVVVIGCNTGGLAVIRSLGRRPDIRIIAAAHNRHEIGCVSKYVSETAYIPHPGRQEREFVEFLLQKAGNWKGALLIETGDYMAIAIAKHKEQLRRHYRIVTPDWSVLKRYIRKSELYALAAECGVPHPKTLKPRTVDEVDATKNEILYPCILKPVDSHEFVSRFKTKMAIIQDSAELVAQFQECFDAGQQMLVQEIVPGPESNLERLHAYVDTRGKLTARFFHNKVRQHPPNFGVMRVGVSTDRNDEVERLAEQLLRQGDYRGFCSVEFRRDIRDGLLKLMEINVRIPRSAWLPIASGVDFPWLMFQDVVLDQRFDVTEYQKGLYWIELYPDLLNILLNRKKENYSFGEYLRPYLAKHKAFAVLSLRDSMPFIKQTLNAARIARSRLSGFLKRRATHLSSLAAGDRTRKPKRLNLRQELH